MTLMTATKVPESSVLAGASSPEQPPQGALEPKVLIDLQLSGRDPQQWAESIPRTADLQRWALAALVAGQSPRHSRSQWPVELTIRITDEAESAELNQRYRGRLGPTNILSFPFELPPGIDLSAPDCAEIGALLGDLVLCAPLVQREAAEQGKTEIAHWTHLVVHGTLHLLGFDHTTASEAASMEALEIDILGALGFPSPYEVTDDANVERRRI